MSAARTRTPSSTVETALLAAASRVLEQEGPDALTVRHIANEAQVAPMGVYSRFKSKAGIIEALFRNGFQMLAAQLAAVDAAADPADALLEAGRRYRHQAITYPALYQLMFTHSVSGFEPSDVAKLDALLAFEELVTILRRGIAAGVFRDDDPLTLAQIFWAACHGWVSLEISGIGFASDADAGHEAMCRALLDGLSST